MVLFYFPPFLACEKYSVRKAFSKFRKKGLNFAIFILAIFKHRIFSVFIFVKVPKIAKSRKFQHAKISAFKVMVIEIKIYQFQNILLKLNRTLKIL